MATPTIASFTASAATITVGDSAKLSWVISNAATVSISNGVGTVSGSSAVVTPAATTTYTLTATNLDGVTANASVTVTVVAMPVIQSFSGSQTILNPYTTGADNGTLSWTVTGAVKLFIDNGVGTVTGNSVNVSPWATTTYTLTASNVAGTTATASATIKVRSKLEALAGTPYVGNPSGTDIEEFAPCTAPAAIATDGSGNLYITDAVNNMVCSVTPAGAVKLIASNGLGSSTQEVIQNGNQPTSPKGNVFTRMVERIRLSKASKRRTEASGSGSQINNALLNRPQGIAVSSDGATIFVADTKNNAIRLISEAADGTYSISTLAGTLGGACGSGDGPGSSAGFCNPEGLAIGSAGKVYVADAGNDTIRQIVLASDGSGTVSTVAGSPGTPGSTDSPGAPLFDQPTGLAVDNSGSLYVSDTLNLAVRKVEIDSGGKVTVSTLVSGASQLVGPRGIAASPDGTNLYIADTAIGGAAGTGPWAGAIKNIAIAANGSATVVTLAGKLGSCCHGDGLGANAVFDYPFGVALDGNGNLFVTEVNNAFTVRKLVLSTNAVSTLVLNSFGNSGGSADGSASQAQFNLLYGGIAADPSGSYYVTDTLNSTIRKIEVAGDGAVTVTTFAGTAGTYGSSDGVGGAAQFSWPTGLVVDPSGSTLYVADTGNNTIRQIDLETREVTTLAGKAGMSGVSDGQGTLALFSEPMGLAIDKNGNLFVADADSGPAGPKIRMIALSTGQVSTPVFDDKNGIAVAEVEPVSLATYISTDNTVQQLFASDRCAILWFDLTTFTATTVAGYNPCSGTQGSAGGGMGGIGVDSQDNLYVANMANNVITRVDPYGGFVYSIVGTFGNGTTALGSLPGVIQFPFGVTIDPTDNLLVTVPNAVLTLAP
jgi:DNA-binding beta-propeller fold protein YncE